MKADITRSTYNKNKKYTKVNAQQGRIQLDADWNEQLDIQAHFDKTMLCDLVGKTGTSIEDSGFEITSTTDGSGFTIGAGRYYVDGIICENNAQINALKQEDLPYIELFTQDLFKENIIVPKEEGYYVVYLDVWQRHITALEDPDLIEVALGRTDTTTRTKNIWQVKTLKVETITTQEALTEFEQNIVRSDGKLRVRLKPATQDKCKPLFESGYSGDENRLYRVEIHSPIKIVDNHSSSQKIGEYGSKHSTVPAFKWSRENAIVTAKIRRVKKSSDNLMRIVIENSKKDDFYNFKKNHWIEVTDDYCELWNKPGQFIQIHEVRENIQENRSILKIVSPPDPSLLSYIADTDNYVSKTPKVRRWSTPNDTVNTPNDINPTPDATQQTSDLKPADTLPTSNDTETPSYSRSAFTPYTLDNEGYIDLESGIQIKFEAGNYVTGDYWLIPARTITKNIEWPTRTIAPNISEPVALPSLMEHHYCPLALLRCTKNGNKLQHNVVFDYRTFFSPATNDLCFYYVSGDGQKITSNNLILHNNEPPNSTIAIHANKTNNLPYLVEPENSSESTSTLTKPSLLQPVPLLLCVGTKIGNMSLGNKLGDFFVRFSIEDTDGIGRLVKTDSTEFDPKTTQIDVPIADGMARCGWIFLPRWNKDEPKITPSTQQVSATLMLKSAKKDKANPCQVAPIFFNATFEQQPLTATQPVALATSGVVKLDFPNMSERTRPLLSNIIRHELDSEIPPAILLSLLPSEIPPDKLNQATVEPFKDSNLYRANTSLSKIEKLSLRFKAVDINQTSFRILVEPSTSQSDRFWYLRWWAVSAQPQALQIVTFELPDTPKPVQDEIVGVYAHIGAIIDSVTFVYSSGAIIKIGGNGGKQTQVSMLKSNDRLISVAYTVTKFRSKRCIGKIVFRTLLGKEISFVSKDYRAKRDDGETFTLSAPEGQYVALFTGVYVDAYLGTLEIAETRSL
jgi:hypothetical protein